jgi:glycosyltransferase involved in cell wall biosynthesis
MSQAVSTLKCSVIMTAKNEERHIRAAISSILAQSLPDFELIVMDDRSVDRTVEIVRDMAREDPRITLLCASGSGRVACLNAALACARAPYVAIMDADDLANPERLALQVRYLAASETMIPAPDGRKVTQKPARPQSRLEGIVFKPLPIMHSAAMMRLDAVREVGGYREALRHQEDTDLFLRLEEIGEVHNLPEVLHYYRQHQNNTSRRHMVAQCASRQLALALARRRRLGMNDWAYEHGRAASWALLLLRDPLLAARATLGTVLLVMRHGRKRRKLRRSLEKAAQAVVEDRERQLNGASKVMPRAKEAA